jgi:hypothetical protein
VVPLILWSFEFVTQQVNGKIPWAPMMKFPRRKTVLKTGTSELGSSGVADPNSVRILIV